MPLNQYSRSLEYRVHLSNDVTNESPGKSTILHSLRIVLFLSRGTNFLQNFSIFFKKLFMILILCVRAYSLQNTSWVHLCSAMPAEVRGGNQIPLEVELQTVISRPVGVRNRTQILCKSSRSLNCQGTLQPQIFLLSYLQFTSYSNLFNEDSIEKSRIIFWWQFQYPIGPRWIPVSGYLSSFLWRLSFLSLDNFY